MSNHTLWVTAKDTIAALATAPGLGSVSIVRLSGPDSYHIATTLCSNDLKSLKANCFCYTKVHNNKGDLLDSALVLRFCAPRSFTGEDVLEIQCHGSPIIAKQILQACLYAGARLAEPGEFSFRAFRNQKIDLCQAESLSSLISAKSSFALKAAKDQLCGTLSQTIDDFQKLITNIVATLEAMIDYPEEGINYPSTPELLEQLEKIYTRIDKLTSTFKEGQRLSDSIRVGIIGKANVGKSSLLNLLLMKERAIVTDEAGTTRDQIEEEIELEGIHFRFIDTAGIRKTSNTVEAIGIERSKKVLDEADLILFLLDSSQEVSTQEMSIINSLYKQKSLIICNKCDLKTMQISIGTFDTINLCTKDSRGLNKLKNWLTAKAIPNHEALHITQERHYLSLKSALFHLNCAKKNITHAPLEIAVIDLRSSLEALSQIIGKNISEQILASIFKNFCVGK
jgi:tRNA modification GTPase